MLLERTIGNSPARLVKQLRENHGRLNTDGESQSIRLATAKGQRQLFPAPPSGPKGVIALPCSTLRSSGGDVALPCSTLRSSGGDVPLPCSTLRSSGGDVALPCSTLRW
ncbi:hypothetical protein NQZ68_020822 [Dissostichus eleginoides]|nr:hypothetical protein NQZ68_020822 [Dissostichus eleginoides]